MARKPWEIPIQYDEPEPDGATDPGPPPPRQAAHGSPEAPGPSEDTDPLDYGRGPHDGVFGIGDDNDEPEE